MCLQYLGNTCGKSCLPAMFERGNRAEGGADGACPPSRCHVGAPVSVYGQG